LKEAKLFISKKTKMFCRLDCKGKLYQIRETFTKPAIIKDPHLLAIGEIYCVCFQKTQKQKGHEEKQLKNKHKISRPKEKRTKIKTNKKHTHEKTHT
jgi:hypothetical protein